MLEQGPQGDILKYHNAEVWVNPYTSHTLLSRREIVTTPPAGELADPSLSIFATLVKDLPALRAIVGNIFDGDITDDLAKLLGIVLALFLRLFPLLVPSVSSAACQSSSRFVLATSW
jgi:hypothetical protein